MDRVALRVYALEDRLGGVSIEHKSSFVVERDRQTTFW